MIVDVAGMRHREVYSLKNIPAGVRGDDNNGPAPARRPHDQHDTILRSCTRPTAAQGI